MSGWLPAAASGLPGSAEGLLGARAADMRRCCLPLVYPPSCAHPPLACLPNLLQKLQRTERSPNDTGGSAPPLHLCLIRTSNNAAIRSIPIAKQIFIQAGPAPAIFVPKRTHFPRSQLHLLNQSAMTCDPCHSTRYRSLLSAPTPLRAPRFPHNLPLHGIFPPLPAFLHGARLSLYTTTTLFDANQCI